MMMLCQKHTGNKWNEQTVRTVKTTSAKVPTERDTPKTEFLSGASFRFLVDKTACKH
jgi:hypothetical protein